jgi:hypothetical protein
MKIEGYLRNIVLAHIVVAIASVSVGMIFGLLQSLSRAKIFVISNDLYYQGLTLHGVLNAVVFTTFFIVGFLYIITETSLKEKLNKNLVYLSFAVILLRASNKSSERPLHLLSTLEGSSHILHRRDFARGWLMDSDFKYRSDIPEVEEEEPGRKDPRTHGGRYCHVYGMVPCHYRHSDTCLVLPNTLVFGLS